jgi:hypothetical protein
VAALWLTFVAVLDRATRLEPVDRLDSSVLLLIFVPAFEVGALVGAITAARASHGRRTRYVFIAMVAGFALLNGLLLLYVDVASCLVIC